MDVIERATGTICGKVYNHDKADQISKGNNIMNTNRYGPNAEGVLVVPEDKVGKYVTYNNTQRIHDD